MEYHELTNKQKGSIGEALLTAHSGYATDLVERWIRSDVQQTPEITEEDPIRVTHDHRVETYYIQYQGDHMSWTPDCLFTAWVAKGFGPLRSSDERRIDYPVEVKTGEYAELERNQRDVMKLLASEDTLSPVVATIDINDLPEQFGMDLEAIQPPTASTTNSQNGE